MSCHILFLGCLPPARGGSMHAMALFLNAIADAGYPVTAISPVATEMVGAINDDRDFGSVTLLRFEMPWVDSFLGYREEVVPAGMEFGQYYDLQAERSLPIVRRVIDRDRPDLIILGHESFLWRIANDIQSTGIPIALFSQGPLAAIANGFLKDELVEPLLELTRQVDIVFPVAEHATSQISQYGINARTVRTIVDTCRFCLGRAESVLRLLGIDEDDIVIGHLSNLRTVKRPLDIVESAFFALQEEKRLIYLIIGDGPLRLDMERRCHELGIAERFRFTGWIPYREVDAYVSACDIAVLSSASEGMPYGALEPMSCKRAVIASKLPWTREVLLMGTSLLPFPTGDAAALAQRTLLCATDRGLRQRIGFQGRRYVERHHSKESVVTAFAEAVKRLMPMAPDYLA